MLNKAILIGHVGQEPEIKTVNGKKMAVFSLATTARWKDKDGEKKEATTWHRIVTFQEGLAKVIESYVKKGSKLYIEGSITNRKWTNNEGEEKFANEITIDMKGKLELLDRKESSRGDTPPDSSYEGE